MIDKHSFTIDINEAGKIPQTANERFRDIFRTYSGKKISVQIEKFKKKRSGEQNSYYWGIVIDILSNELGYTPDEINEILKYKFLGMEEITINYQTLKRIKGTSELSTIDFMAYIEQIQHWAAEMNINIPSPNENFK